MNPSKRLKPIKKLADNKEKVAAQTLGKSVERRKNQTDKLDQLITYRTEYVTSMSLKTQQGISGDQLRHYHHFLTKLDTAIKHQQQVVQQCEQEFSNSQHKWQSDNSRASAITKVIKKLKDKEIKAENKKESAQIDEISTQVFLRSKHR